MALYLEVVEGESVGSKYLISPGFRVGRTTGEILLNDRKVSGLHAQFEQEPEGPLVLVDRGSSNGLLLDGTKVQRIAMLPGVKFRVGKTLLRVLELSGELAAPASPTESNYWKDVLLREVPRLFAQNSATSSAILPFRPALQVKFIEGPQTDQTVLLGYGPRRFGSEVMDVEIQDPSAPPLSFEVQPEANGPRFVTQHPQEVLLNGRSLPSDILRAGDEIRVGKTLIRISFAE